MINEAGNFFNCQLLQLWNSYVWIWAAEPSVYIIWSLNLITKVVKFFCNCWTFCIYHITFVFEQWSCETLLQLLYLMYVPIVGILVEGIVVMFKFICCCFDLFCRDDKHWTLPHQEILLDQTILECYSIKLFNSKA